MEIPRSTLEHAWERSPEQGWRAYYCVADIVDFGYSADDLRGSDQTAVTLWKKASTSLTATTRTLGGGHNIDAAIQSACLAAETAIKGTLAHLGVPENRRKQLGHSLSDLADELIRKAPRADAQRLKDACNHFPGYVSTRYDPHGLSRIDILHLGMRAEYVSAEALRCVSQRDLARTLENDPANSQRPRV
jgi:HEPN domain-containing protein